MAIPLKIRGHDNPKVFVLLTASYWSTIDSVMLHIVRGRDRGHRRLSLCGRVTQSVVDLQEETFYHVKT